VVVGQPPTVFRESVRVILMVTLSAAAIAALIGSTAGLSQVFRLSDRPRAISSPGQPPQFVPSFTLSAVF